MKLRNGSDEEAVTVSKVMDRLRDLGTEYGAVGLVAALRVAKGARASTATEEMLHEYAMMTRGKMSNPVRNVIQSAVTASGRLVSPGEKG